MCVDEELAHLHVFVITTVRFLRVEIYKTDLREKGKDRVIVMGRSYHKSWGRVEYKLPLLCLKSYKPDRVVAFLHTTHCLKASSCLSLLNNHCKSMSLVSQETMSCLSAAANSRCKPAMMSSLCLLLFFHLSFPFLSLPLSHSARPPRSLPAGFMVCDGAFVSVLGVWDDPTAAVWFRSHTSSDPSWRCQREACMAKRMKRGTGSDWGGGA